MSKRTSAPKPGATLISQIYHKARNPDAALGEVRLWRAVLCRAVVDALSPEEWATVPLLDRLDARTWIEQWDSDADCVAELAGIEEASALKSRLQRLVSLARFGRLPEPIVEALKAYRATIGETAYVAAGNAKAAARRRRDAS